MIEFIQYIQYNSINKLCFSLLCSQIIENLDGLTNLEELYLGKNKISRIDNLASLTKLNILSLQCNRLRTIENLEALTNLTQLYLSENGLTMIENLLSNEKLETLDVAYNKISIIQNIAHLTELQEFWVRALHTGCVHLTLPQLRVSYTIVLCNSIDYLLASLWICWQFRYPPPLQWFPSKQCFCSLFYFRYF